MEVEDKHWVAPTRTSASVAIVGVILIITTVRVIVDGVVVVPTFGTTGLGTLPWFLFFGFLLGFGGFFPLITTALVIGVPTTVVEVEHSVVLLQTFVAPLTTFTVLHKV